MSKININCSTLTKDQINEEIKEKTRGKVNVILLIFSYKYDDLVKIEIPNSVSVFYCSNNQITSFAGLTLPDSLKTFNCSYNQIKSFAGLTLPSSLKEFSCSWNQIINFAGLKLPNSLKVFVCSGNQIISFAGLKLPPSLKGFYCSNNKIRSFESSEGETELILPPSLEIFEYSDNGMEIQNFVFPPRLKVLGVNHLLHFVNPKFNSVLKRRLENKVELDHDRLNHDELIFLYFNFKFTNYQQYELIISEVESSL
jgi:hypothetical protein